MSTEKRLKILYLVTHSERGGAQKYVLQLAAYMLDQGNDVMIAAGEDPEGYLFKEAEQQGIQTVHLKHAKQAIHLWHDILSVKEIYHLLKKIKPDIVHLNSSKIGFTGSLAARIVGVHKIIYTAHGFVFNEPDWRRVYGKLLEKISSSWKDSIICVSEHDRITALRYRIAPAYKLITINLGVSEFKTLKQSEARSKLNLPHDTTVIGTIANLYPTKGLQYLIKAINRIISPLEGGSAADGRPVDAQERSKRGVNLVIIGDGPEHPKLEQFTRQLNIENNIHFLGALTDASQYLPAFDIFVLPSVKEGWPYTIMEAAACGLPIVATNVGGIPEIIEHKKTGLLVPPADPTAIANAIQTVLDDSSLASSLASSAKESVRQFSLEKMLESTLKAYKTHTT